MGVIDGYGSVGRPLYVELTVGMTKTEDKVVAAGKKIVCYGIE